jgi:hypothetical protein
MRRAVAKSLSRQARVPISIPWCWYSIPILHPAHMPHRSIFAAFIALMAPAIVAAQTVSDTGTFVVRRGSDTVATEQFARTATRLEGTLALRNARHTSERWTAVVAPDATLPLIEVIVREGADSAGLNARITQRARVIFRDDSAAVDEVGGNGVQTRLFGTEVGAVPYLNLSFALLEQAVRRGRTGAENRVAFFNLGGGQTVSGRLSQRGSDSLLLDIGDVRYELWVDVAGHLLGARIPAQDVVVERR